MVAAVQIRRRGFTLIEVLVALLIFAVIGVISSQLLSQTINGHGRLTDRGTRLADIHRAMTVLQRDIMQLTRRNIRDEYGDPQPPLLIGTNGAIEFSRTGWRNPLQLPRAEVQRVAYLNQDETLIRGYWPVMDRAQDTEPAYQKLLTGVRQIEFFAIDASGNQHTFWPVPGMDPADPSVQLVGIVLRLDVEPFGIVERLWEVPSV
ncbi:MAG: type II secretion system minor pseudopilin GspJ [Pseudomonadota bacterium]